MTTRRRTIVLSVQDDFSRQLREFARQMDAAGDATTQFTQQAGAGGGLGQMAFNLNQIFGAAQQVFGVFEQILSTAQEWASIGVGAQRSSMALTALAGSAQEAERWITAIQDASRGTVTEGEAAASAYQLMRFGLADTAEAAGDFVADMTIIAAINPQLDSTADAINEIQLTMSNMSFMRLDQLGISAGEVRKRIKELQEETAGLSREQAFNIAVMEEIGEQADIVGDGVLTLTENQDQLNKKFREFKEDVGADVNSVLEDISGSVLDLINDLQRLGLEEVIIRVSLQLTDFATGQLNAADEETANQLNSFNDQLTDWLNNASRDLGFGPDEQVGRLRRPNLGSTVPGDLPGFTEQQRPTTFSGVGENRFGLAFPETGPGQMGRNPSGVNPSGDPALAAYIQQLQKLKALQAPGDFVFQAGQGVEQFQRTMEQTFGGLPGLFDQAAGAADGLLVAVTEIGQEGELIVTQWDSLNQKFGIDPDSFDVDVFSRMSEALSEVEVEADLAGEAMLAYQLATGMTTASSEVFDSVMRDLARDLADNTLSANEFALAAQELGQTDLSGVDRAFAAIQDAGDFDAATEFLELVKESPESMENVAGVVEGLVSGLSEGAGDILGLFGLGGGEPSGEAEGVGQAFGPAFEHLTNIDELLDGTPEKFRLVSDSASEQMPIAAAAIGEVKDEAQELLTEMQLLTQDEWVLTVTMRNTGVGEGSPVTPRGPGGDNASGDDVWVAPPEGFADGGFTGPGPRNEPAGVVHRGEFVVPSQGALVVRGGGEGDGEIAVTVPVFLDGEKIAQVVERVANRRGETTRTPRWIAGQRT